MYVSKANVDNIRLTKALLPAPYTTQPPHQRHIHWKLILLTYTHCNHGITLNSVYLTNQHCTDWKFIVLTYTDCTLASSHKIFHFAFNIIRDE